MVMSLELFSSDPAFAESWSPPIVRSWALTAAAIIMLLWPSAATGSAGVRAGINSGSGRFFRELRLCDLELGASMFPVSGSAGVRAGVNSGSGRFFREFRLGDLERGASMFPSISGAKSGAAGWTAVAFNCTNKFRSAMRYIACTSLEIACK